MPYFLLFISIFCACGYNILLHKFPGKEKNSLYQVLVINCLVSCIWAILFAVLNHGLSVNLESVLWGVVYGAVSAGFLLSKTQALSLGPVSIASFMGSSSMLVSTIFGVLYFHESITVLQAVGLVLLVFSMFLIISPKYEDAGPMWKVWCFLFFLLSAGTGIIFKLHQASGNAGRADAMLLVSSTFSAVILGVSAAVAGRKHKGSCPIRNKGIIGYLIAIGVMSCAYTRLNIYLTGALPSIVFFPVFNGMLIILTTVAGTFLFHEKLGRSQKTGLIIGLISLLMVSGIFDAAWNQRIAYGFCGVIGV